MVVRGTVGEAGAAFGGGRGVEWADAGKCGNNLALTRTHSHGHAHELRRVGGGTHQVSGPSPSWIWTGLQTTALMVIMYQYAIWSCCLRSEPSGQVFY